MAFPTPPKSTHPIIDDPSNTPSDEYVRWFQQVWSLLNTSAVAAPSTAAFVLSTANVLLDNAQVLGNLNSGFVKVNNGSGTLTSTGYNTIQASDLANTTVTAGSYGSATQTATYTVDSQGRLTASSNVTVTPAATSITGSANLTSNNDTNVTITLGGTPTGSLLQAVSLTAGWAGTLGLNRGGTNADLSATGGASQVLKQVSTGAAITVGQLAESDISFTDITTNNVSTTKHGYTPKLPNDATKYLDGTGAYSVPAGGAAPTGTLFNFQQTQLTTATTTTSSTFTDIAGISVSITPTSASNKVLVRAVLSYCGNTADFAYFRLTRSGTVIGVATSVGSRTATTNTVASFQQNTPQSVVLEWLDSPATTSATTYKVQWANSSNTNSIYINQTSSDTNTSATPRCVSVISVCEVHA